MNFNKFPTVTEELKIGKILSLRIPHIVPYLCISIIMPLMICFEQFNFLVADDINFRLNSFVVCYGVLVIIMNLMNKLFICTTEGTEIDVKNETFNTIRQLTTDSYNSPFKIFDGKGNFSYIKFEEVVMKLLLFMSQIQSIMT